MKHHHVPAMVCASVIGLVSAAAVVQGASAGTAPTCAASRLSVTHGRGGAAAGSTYYKLTFRNIGGRACTLYGYPGVSFVWRDGSQAGQAASRNPQAHPSTVTLPPGGTAHTELQVADPGDWRPEECHPQAVHGLRVYPPGDRQSLVIALNAVTCTRHIPAADGTPLAVEAVTR